MILTEKEKKVLNWLSNPLYRMQCDDVSIDDLSDEEIISLYNKVDAVIEYEGNIRRSLGNYDEMYVVILLGVKESLQKECNKRHIEVS